MLGVAERAARAAAPRSRPPSAGPRARRRPDRRPRAARAASRTTSNVRYCSASGESSARWAASSGSSVSPSSAPEVRLDLVRRGRRTARRPAVAASREPEARARRRDPSHDRSRSRNGQYGMTRRRRRSALEPLRAACRRGSRGVDEVVRARRGVGSCRCPARRSGTGCRPVPCSTASTAARPIASSRSRPTIGASTPSSPAGPARRRRRRRPASDDRLRLPLSVERTGSPHAKSGSASRLASLADEHRARLGCRLQPGSGVYRVAEGAYSTAAACADRADHDRARCRRRRGRRTRDAPAALDLAGELRDSSRIRSAARIARSASSSCATARRRARARRRRPGPSRCRRTPRPHRSSGDRVGDDQLAPRGRGAPREPSSRRCRRTAP